MQKKAILILGMHRSGTSMVARLLNLHGIRLPSQFSKPNEFNERGYWESPEVQNINDAILTASHSAWFDLREWSMEDMPGEAAEALRKQIIGFLGQEFSDETSVPFALKDPRICRLAPIWMHALKEFGAEIGVVIPYRNPLEVAASLKARDGISTQVAFNLWLRHVLDAEHFSRDCERAIVSYVNLISDWQKGMQAIKTGLHLDWPVPEKKREAAVNEFLSASLRHQKATAEQLGEVAGVDSLVYQTYRLLRSVKVGKSKRFREEFTRLRLELNELAENTSPDIPRHIGQYVKAKVHHPRDPGQIEKVLADRFSMRETLLDLVIQKNNLESQLLELDSAQLKLEAKLQDAKGALESLQGTVAKKVAELGVLGDQNQQLKETVAQKEAELAVLGAQKEAELAVLGDQNQQLKETVAQKEAELAVLGDQNQQLKETVFARSQENQALNTANRSLSRRVVSSTDQIQSLKQKLHAASVELNSPAVLLRRLIQRSRRLLMLRLLRRKFTRMILASGAFDRDWYLEKYPDVEKASDPLLHYLVHGAFEGRNPSAYFDSSWYLESNPDVARQGINPLLHYLAHGELEGRDPNPYFSTDWYLNQNPEVSELGLNPLTHFIQSGDKDGRAPSRLFDSQWYLAKYTDVARAGLPPFYHFITYGKAENRLAHPPSKTNALEISGQPVKVYEGSNATRRVALGSNAEQPRANVMLVAHSAGVRLFGAERSFLDVCRSLDCSRYNIIAVVPTENRDYIELLRSVSDYVYCFPYQWWRKGVATNPLVVKVFNGLLRKHSIELLYGNTIMLREPFMAAREQSVTSVLHAREIISQDPYLQETIGLPSNAIIEDVVERADFLLANSRATCREFGETANTRLLYNTVSSEGFKHLENEPGAPIYVGLISSNIQKKGLEDFIKLALLAEKELPQFVFRVIGPQTVYWLQLEASLADKGVGHNVEFCGYVEDVADAIAMTNIVVNFSLFAESFGRTPAEAMMAARPVIVYEHGALPELVIHGETGFVIPYRKYREALACLKTMAEQPELIASLGAAGRKRATELFDTPVFNAAVQGIFNEALTNLKAVQVSVVIPNFNYAEFLEERISSILEQTVKPSEIIFLDDCSTDNSIELAKKLLDASGIDYSIYSNTDNKGTYHQWLKGVRNARCKYVWIAEADDSSKPEFLEHMLRSLSDARIVLAYSQSSVIDEKNELVKPRNLHHTEALSRDRWLHDYQETGLREVVDFLLYRNSIPNVSACLFMTDTLRRAMVGIDQFLYCGDWALYCRLLKLGGIAYTATPLNVFRRHSKSVTRSQGRTLNYFRELLKIKQEQLREFPVHASQLPKIKKFLDLDYRFEGLPKNSEWPECQAFFAKAEKQLSRRRRIVILTTNNGSFNGGSEMLWIETAMALRAKGHDVIVFIKRWDPAPPFFDSFFKLGIKVCFKGEAEFQIIQEFHPDLIVVSTGDQDEGTEYFDAFIDAGLNYVIINQLTKQEEYWPLRDAALPAVRRAYKNAHRVFFTCWNNHKVMENRLGESIINAQIHYNPYHIDRNATIPWPPMDRGVQIAIPAKLLHIHKGQLLVLELMCQDRWRNSSITINLYGEGPDEARFRKFVADHELTNVYLHPRVPDLSTIWKTNHAILLASYMEGLPIVLVSAMLSRRVPIVTDIGGHAEVIEDNQSGFLARKPTVEHLGDALERAIAQVENWESIGQSARQQILDYLPVDPVADFVRKIEACCAEVTSSGATMERAAL